MPAKGAFPWPSLIGSAVSTPRPTNPMHWSSSSCGVSRYGGFLKWGYPKIIHFNWIFHEINHLFWGTLWNPPFQETLDLKRICCSTSKTILTPHKLRGAFLDVCHEFACHEFASRDRCVKDVPYPCYPFCSVIQRKRWESYTRLSNIINTLFRSKQSSSGTVHSKMIIDSCYREMPVSQWSVLGLSRITLFRTETGGVEVSMIWGPLYSDHCHDHL